MIYLVEKIGDSYECSHVTSVWEVNSLSVEVDYKSFMAEKAKVLEIVINPHWLNIMNRENHHPHLSEKEYKIKERQWNKVLNYWNIETYISEILGGKQIDFITL